MNTESLAYEVTPGKLTPEPRGELLRRQIATAGALLAQGTINQQTHDTMVSAYHRAHGIDTADDQPAAIARANREVRKEEKRRAVAWRPIQARNLAAYRAARRSAPRAARTPRRARPAPRPVAKASASEDPAPPPPAVPRRPAPPVGAPVIVHQKSAPAILGWSSRRYIAFVRSKGVRHVLDRRLVTALLSDVLAALGLTPVPAPDAVPRPAWTDADMRAALLNGARRVAS